MSEDNPHVLLMKAYELLQEISQGQVPQKDIEFLREDIERYFVRLGWRIDRSKQYGYGIFPLVWRDRKHEESE